MKYPFVTALVLSLVLACPCSSSGRKKPVKATTPLSGDELAIYNAVLRQYSHDGEGSLNVSRTTYPLDPSSPFSGLGQSSCLEGIKLENLSGVSNSFHELPIDVLPGKNLKLVDPRKQTKIVRSNDPSKTIHNGKRVEDAVGSAFSTALFSMSEIAFDKEHRFAVVEYRFWCGSLCGNGATVIFKKVDGKWQNTNRYCANWIS